MSWVNYFFQDLGNRIGSVSRLAASIDEEIKERIFMAVRSYTIESNEDTFQPDIVFEKFHLQEKVLILDRALLAGFLMLWLKRCVMPTLPHEVLTVDIVYPAVLLAYSQPLSLLLVMVSFLQSGLHTLTLSFCHVKVMEDKEGNIILDKNGKPKRKTLNLRMELSYTYLTA